MCEEPDEVWMDLRGFTGRALGLCEQVLQELGGLLRLPFLSAALLLFTGPIHPPTRRLEDSWSYYLLLDFQEEGGLSRPAAAERRQLPRPAAGAPGAAGAAESPSLGPRGPGDVDSLPARCVDSIILLLLGPSLPLCIILPLAPANSPEPSGPADPPGLPFLEVPPKVVGR